MVLVTETALAVVGVKVAMGKATIPAGLKLGGLLLKGTCAICHGLHAYASAYVYAQVTGATAGGAVLAGCMAASGDVRDLLSALIESSGEMHDLFSALIESSKCCTSEIKIFGEGLHNVEIQLEQINRSGHIKELQKMEKFRKLMREGEKLVRKCNKASKSKLKYVKKVYYSGKLMMYNEKLQKFLEKNIAI